MGELRGLIAAAGFAGIEFSTWRYDTFSDAPQASDAAAFETRGVDIRAVKPDGVSPSG